MKDPDLVRRLEQAGEVIKLSWTDDLLCPTEVGKCFSRYGLRVFVSKENIEAAKSLMANGAGDVLCTANRVAAFDSSESHYVLVLFEIG